MMALNSLWRRSIPACSNNHRGATAVAKSTTVAKCTPSDIKSAPAGAEGDAAAMASWRVGYSPVTSDVAGLQ